MAAHRKMTGGEGIGDVVCMFPGALYLHCLHNPVPPGGTRCLDVERTGRPSCSEHSSTRTSSFHSTALGGTGLVGAFDWQARSQAFV